MPTSQSKDSVKHTYTIEDAERALTLPKVWWAYAAVLPAAKRLSVWIANRTTLTPNQITLISFAMVMVSAALFFQGSWPALIVGAILYELNYLLDCVDGTVARLKNKGSLEGVFLDFFSDHWKNFAALFGLSYGHYLRHADITVLLAAMLYVFLDQMYLLRDAKVDYMLRKSKSVFFTAQSVFITGFAPVRRLFRWMSRARIYSRPTIVDVWMLVFFIGPVFNRIKLGIIVGSLVLLLIFLYQTVRFFVLAKRSRWMIEYLKSNSIITIALFGTGAMARRFYDWAVEAGIGHKIVYAADNDRKKWGRASFVPEVVSPERLRKREFNIIIVASQHGYYEIAFQLKEMRFRPWKDFVGLAYS